MADEGHGATLAAGTSLWTADITSMSWSGITREAIETSHLSTANAETFIPSDLHNPGALSLTVNYDPNVPPPYTGAVETWTLTFPIPSGGSTGATFAASGFITSFDIGDIVNKSLISANIEIKFSGVITQVDSA